MISLAEWTLSELVEHLLYYVEREMNGSEGGMDRRLYLGAISFLSVPFMMGCSDGSDSPPGFVFCVVHEETSADRGVPAGVIVEGDSSCRSPEMLVCGDTTDGIFSTRSCPDDVESYIEFHNRIYP